MAIGGSDAPIETHSPFAGISAFVNRIATGESKPWNPQEIIDRKTAISAFTVNPRIATGADNKRGRVAMGLSADLAVLDRDISVCPADEIAGTEVLATFCNGRAVYLGK
jgi:predicted amidohydrolase YtcJ